MEASVVHDWLYYTHQINREMADDLFYYMLRETTVSWRNSWRMWNLVRWFGGSRWVNTKKHLKYLRRFCRENEGKRHLFPQFIVNECCPENGGET